MRILYILALSVFFLANSFAQITIIPTETTKSIPNISVLSSTNVIVCGRDSFLSKSVDECDNLIPMTVPGPDYYWNNLYRINVNTSFMLSRGFSNPYDDRIYKSTNDGNSWNLAFDTLGFGIILMVFFDANEGYAVSSFNKAIRFKNGGATRLSAWCPEFAPSAIEAFSDSMVCLGGNTNGVGGGGLSKDRGNTWFGGFGLDTQSEPTDFFFLSKDTIFGVATSGIGGPLFFKTYNQGTNWQKKYIGSCSPMGVFFKNAYEGYMLGMIGGKGVIMKTTDLGQTWTIFNTQLPTQLYDMKFLNDSIAVVSGSSGYLFKWNSKTAVFTGISENSVENLGIKIFPNPVLDKLQLEISGNQTEDLKLNLSNNLGQTVYSVKEVNLMHEIDMSCFAAGIYFLKIQGASGYKTFKIVKD